MRRLLIFILLSALLLCGCGQKPQTLASHETVSLTDALGRNITVKKNPTRVAAMLGSFADVWVLAGGSLCAAAEDSWEDFGLDIEGAVNIGGAHSPNGELLLSASPELVLASASTASHVQMEEMLESAGIPVIYFDVDNFDDYLNMLDICTQITGRRDLYEANGLQLQEQIRTVKAQYQQEGIDENGRKILLLRASASSVKAKGSTGTILGEMLQDMGCINIADSNSHLLENLSVEAVLQAQPHCIFVVTMGSDTEGAKQRIGRMFCSDPVWSSLDAVKQGRLYMMDKTLYNLKPNARWAEAYQKLYETLTNN